MASTSASRRRVQERNPISWQAQKSASTRSQIVEAAIQAFVNRGYASTTTTHIAEEAGLSRGAMLHHFPSKMDIVKAAVRHLHEKRLAAFQRAVIDIPTEADRVKSAVDAFWRHVQHPIYVAFFELSVAARTDAELREVLEPVQKEFSVEWYHLAQRLFPEWNGKQEAFDLALDLCEYIMDGMALSYMTHHSPKSVDRLLEYLEQCIRDLLNQ